MEYFLLDIIHCPSCSGLLIDNDQIVECLQCASSYKKINSGYQFNDLRIDIKPSEIKLRGDNSGTAWRRANWRFYKDLSKDLDKNDVIIDIGAGRADLKQIFVNAGCYIASDIFPYPEINLAGDLGTQSFVKDKVADYLLLSNVIEHLENPRQFLCQLKRILKDDGRIIVAVPFMIKLHQVPVDFGRYTHFYYQKLFSDLGFKLEKIQVVHTPWFFLRVAFNLLGSWEFGNFLSIFFLKLASFSLKIASIFKMTDDPIVLEYQKFEDIPNQGKYSFPAGYQIVFSKDL
jgi:SAM-dependent methyltransferase